MLALFADDAVLATPDASYRGRAAIRSLFESTARRTGDADAGARATLVRHFTSTHQIDVASEDEASGRCYYAVLTDRGLDHWGRYVDAYRRVDGEWLFAHRRVSVDAAVPGGWGDA